MRTISGEREGIVSSRTGRIAAVVLAAGRGTRMISDRPKVLHRLAQKPLIDHVLDGLRQAGIARVLVVVGQGSADVMRALPPSATTVLQRAQLGTGHALLCARTHLRNEARHVLVVPGDVPCLKPETIRRLVRSHRGSGSAATVLTALSDSPTGYGRIIRSGNRVMAIREESEASASERAIAEINSGVYVFDTRTLFRHLALVKRDNRKKEYYLTDVIDSFSRAGLVCGAQVASDARETMGINTRRDLATAEKVLGERQIAKHQDGGVTIVSPETTFIAPDVVIGKDTVIYPFTWIERGVVIGRRCEIGPFAKVREHSRVDDEACVGSFVEIARSRIGRHSRVKHLSYLGDAVVGKNVNIGAGAITANFDGVRKNKTTIQDGASIGSNTVLVAPVRVGKKAKTGAGTIVPRGRNVPAGKTVVGIPAELLTAPTRRRRRSKR
jgi:bifunctional UDP-N-acetylglucosamine pyrophosphorylase/glucosamine-1-phosphate N-acetyltransferase